MDLDRVDRSVSRCIRALLGGIIVFSSALLFVNVFMRYLFLSPIFWAEELARYLMVWLIFLGSGELAGTEGHISVNAITQLLNPKARKILNTLVSLICLIFCSCLAYYSWRHVLRVQSSEQVTAALGFPMWWVYFSIPFSSALMAVRYCVQVVNEMKAVGS